MKTLRIGGITLISVILLVTGYFRERYLIVVDPETILTLIRKYPRIAVTNYQNEISNLTGFSLSPKLTSSILFSILFTIYVAAIVHLLFLNLKFTKLIIGLYLSYMVVCFILIIIGNAGVDYRLSIGLSHYLEDLFLSPFVLMLLIPFTLLKRNDIQSD